MLSCCCCHIMIFRYADHVTTIYILRYTIFYIIGIIIAKNILLNTQSMYMFLIIKFWIPVYIL